MFFLWPSQLRNIFENLRFSRRAKRFVTQHIAATVVLVGSASIGNAEAATPVNVALAANGGVATASSSYSANYPVSAVNDGDRKGTNWAAGGGWNDATFNSYPDWVEIDFSATQTINEIDLFTVQDNFANPVTPTTSLLFSQWGVTDFDVQYWTGSAWTDIPNGSVTGNRNVWRQFTFSNISTSRIRVLINGALNGYSRITEIEAYTAVSSSGTNVALAANGGVATASSSYSANYPVSAVNDGDRKGTNWAAGGGWNDATFNSYPDWVEIDFSATQTINEIDLFTVQDNFANPVTPTTSLLFSQWGVTDFDVQYWTGSAWTDIPNGSVTGNRNVWRQFTFSNISTSRIRVLINGALNGYSRITEIEAYSAAASPTPTPTPSPSPGGTPYPTPTPSPTPSSGVWIAPRTDGQNGTGTQSDPFNGSNGARLHSLIQDYIADNTVVHFAAGTYSVSNMAPRAGMWFLGAGKDVTNFVWDGSPQTAMILGYGNRSGILISDLTLNGQQDVRGSTPMAINAYDCSNFTVRNVRVTNFKGNATAEGFPLAIFCDTLNVTGGLIEYCEVDHCYRGTPITSSIGATLVSFGHGGSGVLTTRVSGNIQYNYVHDCPYTQALGGGGSNSIYQGNVTFGTQKGWYRDIFLANNTQVINNQFYNCTNYGIVASSNASGTDDPNAACDGLVIGNNTITMDPTTTVPVAGVLVVGQYVINTQVYGNSVTKSTATWIQYGYDVVSPGSVVSGNWASSGFTNVPGSY